MGQRTQQIVDALDALTTQVARVAYALESRFPPGSYQVCRRCGCSIGRVGAPKCPVCKEPSEMENDDGLSGVEAE